MDDLITMWADTSEAVLGFVDGPLTEARWSEPSALPDMSVGTLVGHLLHSGILLLEESLDHTVPDDPPLATVDTFSLIPLEADSIIHEGVRSFAATQAVGGHRGIVDRALSSRDRLVNRLPTEPKDRIVGLAWGEFSIPMTLDECLRSRVLELVVHLDDLACSIGVSDLGLPDEAVALTCHLGLDISIRRYGSVDVVRALFRRDRNALDALRPL